MILLSLPYLSGLTVNVVNFLQANPDLVREIGGEALQHVLHSHLRRSAKRLFGGSRRQRRKSLNRKRRWFVDNIIMHHRRLHERNREVIVNDARNRVLARRQALKNKMAPLTPEQRQKEEDMKWRNSEMMKNRAQTIRGRIDSRRLRARSRWVSAVAS